MYHEGGGKEARKARYEAEILQYYGEANEAAANVQFGYLTKEYKDRSGSKLLGVNTDVKYLTTFLNQAKVRLASSQRVETKLFFPCLERSNRTRSSRK